MINLSDTIWLISFGVSLLNSLQNTNESCHAEHVFVSKYTLGEVVHHSQGLLNTCSTKFHSHSILVGMSARILIIAS